MPSRTPSLRLRDIVESARLIEAYTRGLSREQFERDHLRRDATLYGLLRISEAARKLGGAAEELVPGQPWRNVRGFGNALRHDYDELNLDRVWEIVARDLPSLRAACEEALRGLGAGA
jgi:uncharacterized protein with HEPN domain